MVEITPERPLTWREVAAVAQGAPLTLSDGVRHRIDEARTIVDGLVARNIRAYGVNTGVGALHDAIVSPEDQRRLSRNLLMSHAVGVGEPLPVVETRAIMAAQINNFAHGHSGVSLGVVEQMLWLLEGDCTPVVPARGSLGYLTHMAAIGLVMIGEGEAWVRGERLPGGEALARLGRAPLDLGAKEGLSILNGTSCATGLGSLGLARGARLLDAADDIAALSFEALGGETDSLKADAMALHRSPGLNQVAARLRSRLEASPRLAAVAGRHTQDPMSLRAIPHVHGAARDAFAYVEGVINRELASATDNPLVFGRADAPEVRSTAHSVATGVALAMDLFAIAMANVAALAERRLDRLVNPLVSGLPAFLVAKPGLQSGMMIPQYTAAALVADNRRLASPATLDGGITSGLQEDYVPHSTGASLKALAVVENLAQILGIELLCAAQTVEIIPASERSPWANARLDDVRRAIPAYADDRPLGTDLKRARDFILASPW